MKTMRDIMNGATEAFIVCAIKGETVRHLTVLGKDLIIVSGSDAIKVPLETPIIYEQWFMDRGSLLFSHERGTLKFCTEGDILRLPDGTETSIAV